MSSTEQYKTTLTQLASVFSQTAVECVDAFFSKKSELHFPWEVVDQLQSKFDLILTIGSSNQQHSALMYAGIQYESLAAFTDTETMSSETAADLLGEFVNTYSGMIADHEEFTEKFGILTQALPMLYTDGQSYLPFIWGIQGNIYIRQHWIYIGYTIRKNVWEQSQAGTITTP
jgi:hypothetical protein